MSTCFQRGARTRLVPARAGGPRHDGAGANAPRAAAGPTSQRAFARFVLPFWSGSAWLPAWGLGIAVAIGVAAYTHGQVILSDWSRDFFNALERHDAAGVSRGINALPALALFYMLAVTGLVVSRMTLQSRWRLWATDRLVERWLSRERFYVLNGQAPAIAAPEARITDDLRACIEPLTELAAGLVSALVTASAFAVILWKTGGTAHPRLFGFELVIPGYMMLVALGYAAIICGLTLWTGSPLIGSVVAKNDAEARFRATLGRTRENAESIALQQGAASELAAARSALSGLGLALNAVIRRNGLLGLALNLHGALFPAIPVIFAGPKYLAGDIALGEVVQISAAFVAVQGALMWIVDNFVRIADWQASVRRVSELLSALEESGRARGNAPRTSAPAPLILRIRNLTLLNPGGHIIVSGFHLHIKPAERVLLTGPSGTGKSTLVKAISGLGGQYRGEIELSETARMVVIPQKPYIPAGTLRRVLLFAARTPTSDDALIAALTRCGLGKWTGLLDSAGDWPAIMSGGEQQRAAFARLLLDPPDFVILDEATSALDAAGQIEMMRLFDDDLTGTAVLSIGHRDTLAPHHDRVVELIAPDGRMSHSSNADKVQAEEGAGVNNVPAAPVAGVPSMASEEGRGIVETISNVELPNKAEIFNIILAKIGSDAV